MLIPLGTDASVYRFPWATLLLVVVNCALFPLQELVISRDIYVLEFGNGYHPLQWLFSGFAHGDLLHLIGNMIFLATFGMVVEAMMKPHFFLIYYLAIVLVDSFAVQTLMLGYEPLIEGQGCLGASGAIYGLMATAGFLAPGRNVRFLIFFWVRGAIIPIPILICGIFYFMSDFGSAMFGSFEISTALLHVIGFFAGVAMFFGTFKLNWFALDGEDLLSRFRELGGKQPIVSEEHKKRMEEATPRKKFKRKYKYGKRETQVQKLVEHLEQKRYKLAKVKLAQIREEHGRFQLSEAQLIRLINLATSEKDWPGAVDFMNQYVKRFSSHADLIRVKQAKILIAEMKDLNEAQECLDSVDVALLEPKTRALYDKLVDIVSTQSSN